MGGTAGKELRSITITFDFCRVCNHKMQLYSISNPGEIYNFPADTTASVFKYWSKALLYGTDVRLLLDGECILKINGIDVKNIPDPSVPTWIQVILYYPDGETAKIISNFTPALSEKAIELCIELDKNLNTQAFVEALRFGQPGG